MTDILDLAMGEVGTTEAADGSTKYGRWLDARLGVHDYAKADWCGTVWLYLLSEIPGALAAAGGLHREYAYVQNWLDWFEAHGRLSRTAAARRFVWYDWAGTPEGANHMGLVRSVSGTRMRVYEGNHDGVFELVTRSIDAQVMGFGEWWSLVPAPVDEDCWVIA